MSFNEKTEIADTLQRIVDDFEKEHPNIDVKLTTSTARCSQKTRILSGDVPDIMNIYPQIWIFRSGQKQVILQGDRKSYLEEHQMTMLKSIQ